MKKKIFLFLVFLSLIFSYFLYSSIGNNKYPPIQFVKSFVPKEIKTKLRDLIKKEKIDHHGNRLKKVSTEDRYEAILKQGSISFEKTEEDNFLFKKKFFELTKYKSEDLKYSKHPEFNAIGTSYLDFFDNKLILATGHGLFFYAEKDEFNISNKIKLENIKTNIRDIVKYKQFYSSSLWGIKDILIIDDMIYMSYVNELEKSCWNTSILKSKINLKYLNFQPFFTPITCVKEKNEFGKMIGSGSGSFWEGQSGGRLETFGKNKILFSTGEYRYQIHAQDEKSVFGKILSINLDTGESNVVSLGHRNPQGLFFEEDKNYIISTEHGPTGGDEININNLKDTKTKNFGWPISSYGKHYYESEKAYEYAPLYKSHNEYGFVEPLKHYTPGLGISQVEHIKINDELIYFVGALGKKIEEGDMSLHIFDLDKKLEIENYKIWPLGERIRDIVFDKQTETMYLFLETTSSIGIIKTK